jgi:hypothetical protein
MKIRILTLTEVELPDDQLLRLADLSRRATNARAADRVPTYLLLEIAAQRGWITLPAEFTIDSDHEFHWSDEELLNSCGYESVEDYLATIAGEESETEPDQDNDET